MPAFSPRSVTSASNSFSHGFFRITSLKKCRTSVQMTTTGRRNYPIAGSSSDETPWPPQTLFVVVGRGLSRPSNLRCTCWIASAGQTPGLASVGESRIIGSMRHSARFNSCETTDAVCSRPGQPKLPDSRFFLAESLLYFMVKRMVLHGARGAKRLRSGPATTNPFNSIWVIPAGGKCQDGNVSLVCVVAQRGCSVYYTPHPLPN